MDKSYNEALANSIRFTGYYDVQKGIADAKEYLAKYPNDFKMTIFLANLLLIQKKCYEAEKITKNAELRHEELYKFEDVKLSKFKLFLAKLRIKTDIIRDDYLQAKKDSQFYYAMLKQSYTKQIKSCSDKNVFGFIDYKIGNPKHRDDYFTNQLYNYSFDTMLNHIKENHTLETSENVISYFYERIDIKSLLTIINSKIKTSKKYHIGLCEEESYFKFNCIGVNNSQKCNYIKVVTYYGTNKIITAYPIPYIGNLEYTDLSDLETKIVKDTPKTLKQSRIDKFKNKYKDYNIG